MSAALPLAVVLAGGRSARMGRSKAAVPLAGRPLAAWVLAAAARAGLEAVVIAKPETELPTLAVPVWHEPEEPWHPLAGLVAALERAAPRPVIALACDMPFVTPALLRRLAESSASAAVPTSGGRVHPFPGRYALQTLEALRRGLAAEASVRDVLAELGPLELFESEERVLLGVNDPAALARAETLAAG